MRRAWMHKCRGRMMRRSGDVIDMLFEISFTTNQMLPITASPYSTFSFVNTAFTALSHFGYAPRKSVFNQHPPFWNIAHHLLAASIWHANVPALLTSPEGGVTPPSANRCVVHVTKLAGHVLTFVFLLRLTPTALLHSPDYTSTKDSRYIQSTFACLF